jgi:heme oxygenase
VSEAPLELVRRRTHDVHLRVEQLTQSLGVFYSVEKFRQNLVVLWQHHSRARERVSNHADLAARITQRLRELSHDIEHLGSTLPPVVPTSDGTSTSFAAALGETYVIEGSRLGALMIAKLLAKSGITTHGLQSVGGDPQAVRRAWATTTERINALAPEDAPVMAEAASQSFDDLLAAYTSWSHESS